MTNWRYAHLPFDRQLPGDGLCSRGFHKLPASNAVQRQTCNRTRLQRRETLSLTYLAAFDVTTFTRKASFYGDGVGDNHQFHRLVGEPLLHHSEIVKQLVNRAPW